MEGGNVDEGLLPRDEQDDPASLADGADGKRTSAPLLEIDSLLQVSTCSWPYSALHMPCLPPLKQALTARAAPGELLQAGRPGRAGQQQAQHSLQGGLRSSAALCRGPGQCTRCPAGGGREAALIPAHLLHQHSLQEQTRTAAILRSLLLLQHQASASCFTQAQSALSCLAQFCKLLPPSLLLWRHPGALEHPSPC